MSLLVEIVLIGVYGVSAVVVSGAGIAWLVSGKFRKSLIGDHAAR